LLWEGALGLKGKGERKLERVKNVLRAQLIWIEKKKRTGFLTQYKEINLIKRILGDYSTMHEYTNVMYESLHITDWGNCNGKKYTYYILYHKDNRKMIMDKIKLLMDNYTCKVIGKILGYITPSELDYPGEKILYWNINGKNAFCEVIYGLKHIEKYEDLKSLLPSD